MKNILIPTNKSEGFIEEKLFALNVYFSKLNKKVNVYIAHPSSWQSGAKFRIEMYSNLNIRLFKNEAVTAEENLLFLVSRLEDEDLGWSMILGDDDFFSMELVKTINMNCEKDPSATRYAAISLENIFVNSKVDLSSFGSRVNLKNNPVISAKEHLLSYGLISISAGFSNWIIHITKDDIHTLQNLLNRHIKIYWHTFWIYVTIFEKNSRILRLNSPRMYYTTNQHDHEDGSHWPKYSKKMNVALNAPWGSNLLEMINQFLQFGIINEEEVRYIQETSNQGSKFLLGEFIVLKVISEISELLRRGDDNSALKLYKELTSFAYNCVVLPPPVLSLIFRLSPVTIKTRKSFKDVEAQVKYAISNFKRASNALIYHCELVRDAEHVYFSWRGKVYKGHLRCIQHFSGYEKVFLYENYSAHENDSTICVCRFNKELVKGNAEALQRMAEGLTDLKKFRSYRLYKSLPRSLRWLVRRLLV
jgi:hypothetical protein